MRALLLVFAPSLALASPPKLTPADVPQLVVKALATIDPKAPRGTAVVIGTVDKLDVPTEASRLRTQFGKLGLTIVEDRAEATAIMITVAGATGARAMIALSPETSTISVVAKPTSTKPPGRCVAIPSSTFEIDVHSEGIDQDGQRRSGSTFWRLKTSRLVDVDGDAVLDAFVPILPKRGVCPEDFSYRVFVVRGTCGHDVGVVGPGTLTRNPAQVSLAASGYRPLAFEQTTANHGARGIPEMKTTMRTFEVTGRAYRRRTVNTSSGRCHHCAVWHCTKR